MAASDSIPVILLGLSEAVGRPVAQALLPDIEVTFFITRPEVAAESIPRLLEGKSPSQPPSNEVGSGNLSKAPQAVLAGKGYYREIIERIRANCPSSQKGVPWIVADLDKQRFENEGFRDPVSSTEDYAFSVASNMRSTLMRVRQEGNGQVDGVHYWVE